VLHAQRGEGRLVRVGEIIIGGVTVRKLCGAGRATFQNPGLMMVANSGTSTPKPSKCQSIDLLGTTFWR
jgi:hypothetical protein